MKRGRKLGFVLPSPRADPLASTRVSVINMLPYLERAGFDASVVFEPQAATEIPDVTGLAARLIAQRYEIVYFQKVHGPAVVHAVGELAAANVRTVYGVCDWVDTEMVRVADLTVAVTEFLKQLHPEELRHKIVVVHDAIERADIAKSTWGDQRASRARPLRCILVTSASLDSLPVLRHLPEWVSVSVVGRYPARDRALQRFQYAREALGRQGSALQMLRYLRFLAHPRIELVPWDPVLVYDRMVAADIGIIPIDRTPAEAVAGPVPSWKIKSENRLTMKMAAALPVIATPIPSYLPVVRQGENAFLAEGESVWLAALDRLRSPAERMRIGRAARASVIETFSQEAQARRLVAALQSLLR
jgi:glycosyltransferase involved in cell wall biosynthesis